MNEARLRVVIIEDSAIIRARLGETLAEIPNVEVVGQAGTEFDALSLLGGGEWDVAILDLQLKHGTGLAVLKKLRQEGRPAAAKVIVFTNYAFPQYRDRSMSLGADFFFDKSTAPAGIALFASACRALESCPLRHLRQRRTVSYLVRAFT